MALCEGARRVIARTHRRQGGSRVERAHARAGNKEDVFAKNIQMFCENVWGILGEGGLLGQGAECGLAVTW